MSAVAHPIVDHNVPAGEPPHIHHMDTVTAYGAAKLGMWLFLATEILLFAVMFCSFAIMRYYHLAEFHDASKHLNIWAGGFNTIVLLISSFTAAVAVTKAQKGKPFGSRRRICRFLKEMMSSVSSRSHRTSPHGNK